MFTEQQYLQTFDERLQKHFDNFGRFNLSVADSSFDTWLDGYAPGIPNRKTNIYDEGNLLAFVTDMFIRKNTDNKKSLDDVMRYLNDEFALKGKGYSQEDYKGIVEHFANTSYDVIFNNYINGTTDYEPLLRDAMDYIGYELALTPAHRFHEHAIGVKVIELAGVCKVVAVYQNSVADVAGITIGDEIMAVNNMQIKPDGSATTFNEWCNYFSNETLQITFASVGVVKQVSVLPQPNQFYKIARMQKQKTLSEKQRHNFNNWIKSNN